MISEPILTILLLVFAATFCLFFIYASIISIIEKEKIAATKFFFFALILPLPYLAPFYLGLETYYSFATILVGISILGILILSLPIKTIRNIKIDSPQHRIDERDIVFSRRKLIEGSDRYKEYYERHPENLEPDQNFKSKPGLCSKESNHYNAAVYASTDATFQTVEHFLHAVDGEKSSEIKNFSKEDISTYIKNWLKHLGALNTGICLLKDEHLYSIRGREFNYGETVTKKHKYAIAFTVEMDHHMTASGPMSPTLLESAQQYLNAGSMAVQVANFIRALGHEAKAHIDGNYEVLCPLVAKDAGLGEIGRMGLLMTPKLGPRVRLAVVTTNIPLLIDNKKEDKTMIDFCNKCMKCAEVCPSNSISFEDREIINGVRRWQIDSTSCFTFWCTAGTDCGRCMAVCPYSHPDNFLHNIIRFGIRNNFIFRKLAIWMDDYFYGKKPKSKDIPKWMDIREL